MLNSDAQMFLNRCNEMRIISRHEANGVRPLTRTTDVNAFLDRLGLGGRMRKV
jgi:hypothetical protein